MLPDAGNPAAVAYFSMEIGLESAMPTYSGGLGVLAGDSLRAAADLGIPLAGVTLLHRKGYFRQRLDGQGRQTEAPEVWSPEQFLEPLERRVSVLIEGRQVHLRAWRYLVRGVCGHEVPVYLLDADLPGNTPADRRLTDELYGGGPENRLCQEIILGIGGDAMLRALGHTDIGTYHMNEGHSGFLTIALLEEDLGGRDADAVTEADLEAVRRRCVFTVHTPVAAGHDTYPLDLLERFLGSARSRLAARAGAVADGVFNLTHLAMAFARSANGVSMRHGQVSREMFPGHAVSAITNGVHAATWAAPAFAELFDRHLPLWRHDNLFLRYALGVPPEEIRLAHARAKEELLAAVAAVTGVKLDMDTLTVGFARRATGYKRAGLLFSDMGRLRRIVRRGGPLQVIYAGKAHPRDESGHALIEKIFAAAAALRDVVRVVYLEGHDMALARDICAGVDLWLNNPQKPLEASGTSGMKAALNGVPSLSVLDGWWIEGHIEGVTGWSIGEDWQSGSDDAAEARSLYDKLEYTVLPLFYNRPAAYTAVMRSTIALNGSYFNAQRMMSQYLRAVYDPPPAGDLPPEVAPA
ncbi:MAG: alpha-glucan family phosphorylase [Dehalococcoidia bacterium]|nr:alpha-glucan family phosphorylase [Dehalococcoidia bacterium]